MQVNKTNDIIGNFEFYLDSEYIIKDKILDSICSRNFETNVKCNDQKLLIIFKNDDILLDIKLTNDELRYRISIIHSKPKIDETFIYCKYDEVKENDYNISVNSYLKSNVEETTIDIIEVNKMLEEVVPRQQQIRKELEEIIKELEVDYHE